MIVFVDVYYITEFFCGIITCFYTLGLYHASVYNSLL